MFSTHLIRITHVFALAAVVAFLAAPAVALGDSTSGTATPDWFERYVAAHPYGTGTAIATPDWFERYAAAHPFGRGVVDTIQVDGRSPDTLDARDAAQLQIVDGRSPDTLDAVTNAGLQVADGRSPDTLDAVTNAGLQVADGRSPDTLDAAQTVQPIELVQPGGFDWSDAVTGAGVGAAIIALLGSLMVKLMTHRRRRVQTT